MGKGVKGGGGRGGAPRKPSAGRKPSLPRAVKVKTSRLTPGQLELGHELAVQVKKTREELANELYIICKLDGARQNALRPQYKDIIPPATLELCKNRADYFDEVYNHCPGCKKGASMVADAILAKKIVIYSDIQVPGRPAFNYEEVIDGKYAHQRGEWKYYDWGWLASDDQTRRDFKGQ